LAIQALAQSATVSDLAARHGVSRKFVYQQTHKARSALDDAFSPATPGNEVLFELAVTKAWLRQAIVGLTLICRSSYRGIVEFLRDLLGLPVSAASPGTRDASARCVSRCRTSATPCSLSPACSMASWPTSITELLVREACLLHRVPTTSPAYWLGWNRLRAQTRGKFHALFAAVSRAMADTSQQLARGDPQAASRTRHPSNRNPALTGRRFPRALCNPKRPESEPRRNFLTALPSSLAPVSSS